MKIRIEIKTPDGLARGVIEGKGMRLKMLRRMLGINLKHDNIEINKENNLILWHVDSDIRTCMKINRNVFMYDRIVSGVFSNKMMKKAIKRHMNKDQQKEIKNMLSEMTKITVVKE